ncbi:MAG TPA: aminotransferase class IV, partial [Nocardioidaceae bacterium]|nr:aminotransferase class IV [Nocardioidaceae bacterium]
MRVWLDGKLLHDPRDPVLSVLDHGFTVGDGVFETLKVVDGRAFALTRHLRRLGISAAGLGLALPDISAVHAGVEAVLSAEPLARGRLRITYTGGVSPLASDRGDAAPTLVVAAADLPGRQDTTAVVTVPWTRNERGALAGLKSTSYGENVVALAAARRAGASEAIFANTAGDLCEGTGSNVFYVVDGELRTPTLASGCLPGVTRALVLEWFGAAERDAPLEVLRDAEEVFLVSTTRDVQPVVRCDGRELAAPGPVTARAQRCWAERER